MVTSAPAADGLGRGLVRERPVSLVRPPTGPDHEDDPRDARSGGHGRDGARDGEHRDEERDQCRAREPVQRFDPPTPAVGRQARSVAYSYLPAIDQRWFTGARTAPIRSIFVASGHRFYRTGTAAYHRRMADTAVAGPRHTNRLAGETSPYLLQHAHNPVDWFPWGPEALARATLLDRPIFLSIGYAACHWCHVMERESFEDEATAADAERAGSSRSRSTARSAPTSTSCTWAPSRR